MFLHTRGQIEIEAEMLRVGEAISSTEWPMSELVKHDQIFWMDYNYYYTTKKNTREKQMQSLGRTCCLTKGLQKEREGIAK